MNLSAQIYSPPPHGVQPSDLVGQSQAGHILNLSSSLYSPMFSPAVAPSTGVCVCVCFCLFVCMYVCIYVHMHVYICTNTYTHVYVYTYICVRPPEVVSTGEEERYSYVPHGSFFVCYDVFICVK